jgi:hypothetical protein
MTRWAPLLQQKPLTFITAHQLTQPCSILSLNNNTMGAPSAAETSYLYHRTWVHTAARGAPIVSLLKDKIEQGWVNWCALIKVRSFCCTRGTHRVTVQRQDCLNSDTMGAPSAAETSYLHQSPWVHSALFNLAFEQWHDGCPWCSRNVLPLSQHTKTRLNESEWTHVLW